MWRGSRGWGGGGYIDYSMADGFGGFLGLCLIVVIVLLIIAFFCLCWCINQVIKGWRQSQGKSRQLRIALRVWALLTGVLLLSAVGGYLLPGANHAGILVALPVALIWLLSSVYLVWTGRVVETEYRRTFLTPEPKLINQVLSPWMWVTRASDQAA